MNSEHKNLGYDPDIVIASKKRVEEIHIAGLGRFCKLGCGKRIVGKTVKRKAFGKILTYELPPLENQVFCCRSHKNMYHDSRVKSHKSISSIDCHISLIVNHDNKKPFRLMRIYLKKGVSKEIRITQNESELWSYLDSLCEYRNIKPKEVVCIVR